MHILGNVDKAHLDCVSVSTRVLLGQTSFTKLYKDGDKEAAEEEEANPATRIALHPGHNRGCNLPATAELSHLCFQVLLLGCNNYSCKSCLATPTLALHLNLFLPRNHRLFISLSHNPNLTLLMWCNFTFRNLQ